MMTEIAQNLCYSLELSDIVFFKPKEKFLLWLKNFKKSVIDCGAGTGYFGMEANKVGIKVLGIDLYDREKIYSPVLTPVDSTSYEFPKNTIALISRPNRGCWIHETFQNAINQNISLVYVGLKKHLIDDIYDSNLKWKLIMNDAGEDEEIVYFYESKGV